MAKKRRLSLTKTQQQAGAGAELLVLCQSITEDGRISKEEILELRRWLKVNSDSDLPAIGFLTATVEQIIADRIVTKEERRELYQAIEKVLPPEIRKDASAQRRAVETNEKERIRTKREADKQRASDERKRNRPLARADFMVAGVHHEGRPDVIRQYVLHSEDDRVYLARDHENQYSRNAIEIRISNGMQIGYVPESDAVMMAPLLDKGCPFVAFLKKVLSGGSVPIPIVVAAVHRSDATVEGMVFEKDVPEKRSHVVFTDRPADRGETRESGCLLMVATALFAVGLAVLCSSLP